MSIRRGLTILAACCAMAGCSPLAPRPIYSKFFVLSPLANGAGAASASAVAPSRLAIGVGPIDFPGYLRRPEVVTRVAANQIDLSPEKRWAEPLDRNFKRVLSEDLSQLLNTYRVHEYPWNLATRIDYQIAVHVLNFETDAGGQSQLKASWIIKDGRNGRDLYASQTIANTPVGGGESGVSAALSTDLATLSRAIATQVTALSLDRPAPPAL